MTMLAKPVHHDGNEHAVNKLAKEELRARRIPAEKMSHGALCDGLCNTRWRKIHLHRHAPDNASCGHKHAERLQSIRADDVLDAASTRIKKDGEQDDTYCENEWKT